MCMKQLYIVYRIYTHTYIYIYVRVYICIYIYIYARIHLSTVRFRFKAAEQRLALHVEAGRSYVYQTAKHLKLESVGQPACKLSA